MEITVELDDSWTPWEYERPTPFQWTPFIPHELNETDIVDVAYRDGGVRIGGGIAVSYNWLAGTIIAYRKHGYIPTPDPIMEAIIAIKVG